MSTCTCIWCLSHFKHAYGAIASIDRCTNVGSSLHLCPYLITWDRRQSKRSLKSTNADQKSSSEKWQSKTLFLTISIYVRRYKTYKRFRLSPIRCVKVCDLPHRHRNHSLPCPLHMHASARLCDAQHVHFVALTCAIIVVVLTL